MRISVNDLGTIKEYKLEKLNPMNVTIGRSSDRNIVIEDNRVSRFHGEFVKDGGRWYICDTNSKNGIELNGIKVEEEELKTGDVIALSTANADDAVVIVVMDDEYTTAYVTDSESFPVVEDEAIEDINGNGFQNTEEITRAVDMNYEPIDNPKFKKSVSDKKASGAAKIGAGILFLAAVAIVCMFILL